jgi:hypothetical protein
MLEVADGPADAGEPFEHRPAIGVEHRIDEDQALGRIDEEGVDMPSLLLPDTVYPIGDRSRYPAFTDLI